MRRTIISTMCMAVTLMLVASCNKAADDRTTYAESNGKTVINVVAEGIISRYRP